MKKDVLTPEQAALFAKMFLASVHKEYEITKRVLAAVPPEKCQYRPHPDSRSALELAWHIASVDVWFLDGFLLGKFEMEDDNMPGDFHDSTDVIAYYEDNFPSKLEKVGKLVPEFWATPITFFEIYNFQVVMYLQFMLSHTIHHRGQLAAYLRPMGAKVPSIYGGSFDEPMETVSSNE
jgi:uncharacterized damage-inducible protein DinB